MLESLSKLKLEYWYHLLIVLGAAGAFAAMTIELKGVANAHALVMSLGILCVGIGEWVNHPLQQVLVSRTFHFPAGKLTGHPRKNCALGVLLDISGIALIATAIYKIVQAT